MREVRGLIRELAGRHTILLSTHNLAEVELTCDRIIMLARGRVRASGTIDELRNAAAGEDRYVVECNVQDASTVLAAIEGVGAVESVDLDGAWRRLTVTTGNGTHDLRESIAQAIAHKGGTVRELHREAPTLERLFVRLVDHAETSPSAGGAEGVTT